MKFGSFLTPALFLGALVGIANTALAAGSGDMFVCHGGGRMKVELWHRGLKLHYSKAANAAATHTPAPGECAPVDRHFEASDPAMLSYSSTRLDDVTVYFGADGVITGFAVHGSHGAPAQLRTLLDGVRGRKLFRVHVTRPGCNGRPCPYFTVTSSAN